MLVFSWVITLIATCFALLGLGIAIFASNGAPQQAAGAAIACATCVIPYVFTRALEGVRANKSETQARKNSPTIEEILERERVRRAEKEAAGTGKAQRANYVSNEDIAALARSSSKS